MSLKSDPIFATEIVTIRDTLPSQENDIKSITFTTHAYGTKYAYTGIQIGETSSSQAKVISSLRSMRMRMERSGLLNTNAWGYKSGTSYLVIKGTTCQSISLHTHAYRTKWTYSTTAADDNFATSFPIFERNKE